MHGAAQRSDWNGQVAEIHHAGFEFELGRSTFHYGQPRRYFRRRRPNCPESREGSPNSVWCEPFRVAGCPRPAQVCFWRTCRPMCPQRNTIRRETGFSESGLKPSYGVEPAAGAHVHGAVEAISAKEHDSMPRADKPAYSDKQTRQAERGTVNKETGGGKRSGSGGASRSIAHPPARAESWAAKPRPPSPRSSVRHLRKGGAPRRRKTG